MSFIPTPQLNNSCCVLHAYPTAEQGDLHEPVPGSVCRSCCTTPEPPRNITGCQDDFRGSACRTLGTCSWKGASPAGLLAQSSTTRHLLQFAAFLLGSCGKRSCRKCSSEWCGFKARDGRIGARLTSRTDRRFISFGAQDSTPLITASFFICHGFTSTNCRFFRQLTCNQWTDQTLEMGVDPAMLAVLSLGMAEGRVQPKTLSLDGEPNISFFA